MTLGIRDEPPAGTVEGRLQAQTCKHIEQAAIFRSGMLHVIAGHEGNPRRLRQSDEAARSPFLSTIEMPVNLDVALLRAKQGSQTIEAGEIGIVDRSEHRALPSRDQGDEPTRMLFQIIPAELAFPLGGTQLARSDEPAEISVAAMIGDEESQPSAIDGDIGTNERS